MIEQAIDTDLETEGPAALAQPPDDPEQRTLARQRLFDRRCQKHGVPRPVHDYADGGIVIDMLFYDYVAVFVQHGQHPTRETRNRAACLGYLVLVVTEAERRSGWLIDMVRQAYSVEEH